MDPLLLPFIIGGALGVVVLALLIWVLVGLGSMRRLGASVDERWTALAAVLDRRAGAAAPLLASASEGQRAAAQSAFAALEAADAPGEKAAAEAGAQQALRPLLQAAAQAPVGSDAAEARSALAQLDDEAQARRRDYNTGARELNAKARRFPTSMFVGAAGGRRDFFEVDQSGAVAEPPRIQF